MTYHMYMKFGFLWFSYYLDIIYIYIYSRDIVHFWFSKSSCLRFRGFHTKAAWPMDTCYICYMRYPVYLASICPKSGDKLSLEPLSHGDGSETQ